MLLPVHRQHHHQQQQQQQQLVTTSLLQAFFQELTCIEKPLLRENILSKL
jgi:hypothetical protein